ncbi:MAG: amidohydrolase family protein [Candidatus Oleimicrobiaceae bacterium]
MVGRDSLFAGGSNSASWETRTRQTIRAAEAFHLSDRGTIAVGQVADLALVELPGGVFRQELAQAQVRQVLVAGRVAWKDGEVLRPDLGRMLRKGGPPTR